LKAVFKSRVIPTLLGRAGFRHGHIRVLLWLSIVDGQILHFHLDPV